MYIPSLLRQNENAFVRNYPMSTVSFDPVQVTCHRRVHICGSQISFLIAFWTLAIAETLTVRHCMYVVPCLSVDLNKGKH